MKRLTTDKTKIFIRENPTLMSINKENLRKHYNEIFDRLQEYEVETEQREKEQSECKYCNTLQCGNCVFFEDYFGDKILQDDEIRKIKVSSAEIIVRGNADKPYYEIKYCCIDESTDSLGWHIGYGSYCLKYVFEWLNECFEIVEDIPVADVAEVRHGKNITDMHPVDEFICSECGFGMNDYTEVVTVDDDNPSDIYYREFVPNYCPNCGARMDGD